MNTQPLRISPCGLAHTRHPAALAITRRAIAGVDNPGGGTDMTGLIEYGDGYTIDSVVFQARRQDGSAVLIAPCTGDEAKILATAVTMASAAGLKRGTARFYREGGAVGAGGVLALTRRDGAKVGHDGKPVYARLVSVEPRPSAVRVIEGALTSIDI